MKIVFTLILLLSITSLTTAELTSQDKEWISALIDRKLEPIKLDITEIRGEIKAIRTEIQAFEGKMTTKDDLIALKGEISEMKGKVVTKDNIITIQRSLTIALVTAWITLIAAIITIPYLYGRADRERVRQLESDLKELQKLKAEVETLKAIKEAEENRKEKARKLAQEKPEFEEAYKAIGLI